jgi:hypothetical protein
MGIAQRSPACARRRLPKALLARLAASLGVLVAIEGCRSGDSIEEGRRDAIEQQSGARELTLGSRWAEVRLSLEGELVGDRFAEAASAGELGQVNFRINLDTGAPAAEVPDENDRVVVVQLEMNSPTWITKQLNPRFLNHFSRYAKTQESRYELEFWPLRYPEANGGFLLADPGREFPIMIECDDRPADLPTRCQLWQRREYGFTISIYFNGSRLPDWATILRQTERFVLPRVHSVQPRRGISGA